MGLGFGVAVVLVLRSMWLRLEYKEECKQYWVVLCRLRSVRRRLSGVDSI